MLQYQAQSSFASRDCHAALATGYSRSARKRLAATSAQSFGQYRHAILHLHDLNHLLLLLFSISAAFAHCFIYLVVPYTPLRRLDDECDQWHSLGSPLCPALCISLTKHGGGQCADMG